MLDSNGVAEKICILEALGEVICPICNGRCHEPAVNVVKGLIIRPIIFDIVNYEGKIRRHTVSVSHEDSRINYLRVVKVIQAWLNGREINPDNLKHTC